MTSFSPAGLTLSMGLQMLVGILGVDPSEDTDDVIFEFLSEAQEAPLHEEWVRLAAGLP
jgi:hypothetical protein